MYEIEYLNEKSDKILKAFFWDKKSADKFLEVIEKDENLILLAITNNSNLYQ